MKDHMKDIAPVIDTHAHLWKDAESRKLDKMAEDGIISQVWIQAHECHRVTETYRSASNIQFHQKMMFGTDVYYGQSDPDAIYRAVLFMHEFFRRDGETYGWGTHVRDLMYNNARRFRDEPDRI